MTEAGEDRVREAFERLRAGSADAVPPFERVWAAAVARAAHTPPSRMGRRLVWGGLLAAAAAVVLLIARGSHQPPVLALSTWQSPTEFLLQARPDVILGSLSRLSASVVDVPLGGREHARVAP